MQGVVSSASPEATQAGVEILNKGGNAIDAAVAVSFALGVTEPAMSGLGGGTQLLVGKPGARPFMINGTTMSPAGTPTNLSENDLTYHQRSTIPSTVKVLYYAWEKYGSGHLEWEALLQPAIRFAEQGFTVGPFRHIVYKRYEEALKKSPFYTHLFLSNHEIPAVGEKLKQPILAQTLKRLAKGGADEFYWGSIAREIAEDMEKNGGFISLQDLKDFPDPVEIPAIATTYRDYEVFTSTPPCGGWTMLLALNILEETLSEASGRSETERAYGVLKALETAHRDRRQNPIRDLVNFQAEVRLKIDKQYPKGLVREKGSDLEDPSSDNNGETTHFSVVDGDGLAVAVTASINAYFGAKAASPQLGFLYNTYMDDFYFGNPDHPYAIGPGRMAYSSMTPTIVRKNGENVLVLGSPGSARIISAVAQVISSWIDEKEDIVATVSKPRYHVNRDRGYLEYASDSTKLKTVLDSLGLKNRSAPSYSELRGRNAYFGGVHAIAREDGKWVGAADPRRDGTVGKSH